LKGKTGTVVNELVIE